MVLLVVCHNWLFLGDLTLIYNGIYRCCVLLWMYEKVQDDLQMSVHIHLSGGYKCVILQSFFPHLVNVY